MRRVQPALALRLLLALPLVTACLHARGGDPASSDLRPFDRDHPPRIVGTRFEVEGSGLNAIVYEAQGQGPHPTVVLLHGYPGEERNLDLAQAVRRAGWNVVFFHYRGAWGSEGEFSFLHALEDVAGVVTSVSAPDFAAAHRIDPQRIALVGHSMGGFAALVSGAELPAVDCVVSLAGANLGGLARAASADAAQGEAMAASLDGWSGPIRGPGGRALVSEIAANVDRFDTTRQAPALARKDLLLVAGDRDAVTPPSLHHVPLVEALQAASAASLETEIYPDGDHAFSGQRIALARRVTRWLETRCTDGE